MDDGSVESATDPRAEWERTARRAYAALFVTNALVGVALWLTVFLSDTARRWFEIVPDHPAVTNSFVLPDLAVIVPASIFAAVGAVRERWWTGVAVGFTVGAVLYPTVFLVAFLASTGEGGPPLAIMTAPALLCSWAGAHLASIGSR